MNKVLATAAVGIFGLAMATPVLAAEGIVSSLDGKAMVRHGNATAPGKIDMPLTDGDVVSVVGEGRLVISYDKRCDVEVTSGKTVVVGPNLCPKAAAANTGNGQLLSGNVAPVVGGVVIAGGIAAGAIAASKSNSGASD